MSGKRGRRHAAAVSGRALSPGRASARWITSVDPAGTGFSVRTQNWCARFWPVWENLLELGRDHAFVHVTQTRVQLQPAGRPRLIVLTTSRSSRHHHGTQSQQDSDSGSITCVWNHTHR